jgi:hypothetical protein
VLQIRAGDVEFVGGDSFRILKNPNHFGVLGDSLPEDIGDYKNPKLAELGQLVGYEGADADVLQPDGVEHAARGLAHARGGVPGFGLDREAFNDQCAEAAEVDQVGELDPVAEGATGGNDGVFEEKAADLNSEVDPRGAGGANQFG